MQMKACTMVRETNRVQYWQLQLVRVWVRGGADVLIKSVATYGFRNVK